MLQDISIVLLSFLLIKETWKKKMRHSFHKNIKQHNCFTIDNNKKCVLSMWTMKLKNSIPSHCYTNCSVFLIK